MKKILKGLGYVLTVLAMIFVIRKLFTMDVDVTIFWGRNIWIFVLCIVAYAVLVYFLGKPWKKFVEIITGQRVSGREAYYICTKANLMKYIPGNVFQFVGRNEIALNHDMRHKDVACATLLDTVCMVLAALTVAIVFHFKGLLAWVLQYASLPVVVMILLLLCISGVAILLFLYRKIAYFRFAFEKDNLLAMATGTAFFWIFYIGSAIMFMLVLYVVAGTQFPVDKITVLIGTWAIGYLMGYVMPGAPGGMGIRELVLCFLLQEIVGQEEVLLATVILRVLNIIGEVLAFSVAFLLDSFRRKHISGEQDERD